jgi:hypothetical protein
VAVAVAVAVAVSVGVSVGSQMPESHVVPFAGERAVELVALDCGEIGARRPARCQAPRQAEETTPQQAPSGWQKGSRTRVALTIGGNELLGPVGTHVPPWPGAEQFCCVHPQSVLVTHCKG